MAKIAKPKKREPSTHSRAFRRHATPPKDVPVSKKPAEENEHWLYNAQNAGVHKKSATGKRGNTRQQHARQLKAMEKADANSAKHEIKVAKSKQQSKKIQARAKDWDDLNEELVGTKPRKLTTDKSAGGVDDVEAIGDENAEPMSIEATKEASERITEVYQPVSVPQATIAVPQEELDMIN